MIYAIRYRATGYFDPIKYCVCEFAAVSIETGDTFHCSLRVSGPWQNEEDKRYHQFQNQLPFDDFIISLNKWLEPGFHEWLGLSDEDGFHLRDILTQTKLAPDPLFFNFSSKDFNHKSSLLTQARTMADIYRGNYET